MNAPAADPYAQERIGGIQEDLPALRAALEASRIRNSGLRAEIDNLRAALAQAQTLIASGIHAP